MEVLIIPLAIVVPIIILYFWVNRGDPEKYCEVYKAENCGYINTPLCKYPNCDIRDTYVYFLKHGEFKEGTD